MFSKAQPVWLRDRETEVNLAVQFKALCPGAIQATARIATSGYYHLNVNGHFVACGPARAGKGHFRMDEIDLSSLLTQKENVVVLEVCGYNAFSFELQKQPSFLQAEIVSGGKALVWTGAHFTARVSPFRRRKTQRYSFQRVFSEAYHITYPDTFLTDPCPGTEPLAATEKKQILPRYAPYPQYETSGAEPLFSGTIQHITPAVIRQDRAWTNVSEQSLTGFPIPELEVFPTEECQHFRFIPAGGCRGGTLAADTYTVYQLPYNMTGMLRWMVTCEAPMTLYVLFDEVLKDGQVDFLRLQCANVIRYDLCAGEHALQTFNVYTMHYVQMVSIGGGCTVTDPVMVQYKHPPVQPTFTPGTPALRKIMEAAIETFRQNAVDIFIDCPSRERAGWLCDSFFTGRVEYQLTGKTAIETGFLENFLHEECYAALPEGMFPMCYPADHMDETFIPQWAMWLVLELREYQQRGGSAELIARYRPRVDKLFAYFRRFENSDGLLEDLEGWNFVEWSQANQLTKNVNYPTNMLYAAALRAAAELYDDEPRAAKAERILDTVRRQSFDGQFFVDNALRQGDVLVSSGQRTEVCQYYAFFFGAATPESNPELLRILVEDFGPERSASGKWPQIFPANAFIGNYLRLEILMRLGYRDTVRRNMEGFFLYMAEQTGTLWENMSAAASCNHGFASYVLCWLNQLDA